MMMHRLFIYASYFMTNNILKGQKLINNINIRERIVMIWLMAYNT